MLEMRSRSRRGFVGWRWVVKSNRSLRRAVREADTIVVRCGEGLAKVRHVTSSALGWPYNFGLPIPLW